MTVSPPSPRGRTSPSRRLRPLFLVLLSACAMGRTEVAAPSAADVVRDFYAAYSALDFDEMFAFYAEDVRFADPTIGMEVVGRAVLREQFEQGFAPVDSLGWTVDELFGSGPWVVVRGRFGSRIPGERVGRPGWTARAEVDFFAVFELRDGRIVAHTDFAAYDQWDAANPWLPVPSSRRHEDPARLAAVRDVYTRFFASAHPPGRADLESIYRTDVDFADPTFALVLRGRDELRALVARVAAETALHGPRTSFLHGFASGAFIALWGRYAQEHPQDSTRRLRMRFLTVLEVRAGLIHWQRDYYEAESFLDSLGYADGRAPAPGGTPPAPNGER